LVRAFGLIARFEVVTVVLLKIQVVLGVTSTLWVVWPWTWRHCKPSACQYLAVIKSMTSQKTQNI